MTHKPSHLPRLLAPRTSLVLLGTLLASACNASPGESLITVTALPPTTILADGSPAPGTTYTVGDGHLFRVRATVTLDAGATFDPTDTGVSVIYIDPVSGREESGEVTPAPSDPTTYEFDLPGSDDLDLCEPMFYRWSAVYDITDGERGVYLGEVQYVLPAQHRPTPNSVQQAQCQAPSQTPWGGA